MDLATKIYPTPSPHGVGIFVPAFLDGKDGPAAGIAGELPRIGLTGVAFDPRGTWESPGTEADLGPSTQLDDIRALIDTFAGTHRNIVLIGQCYGGLLAGLAAEADPRITAVVALMPSRCFIWPDEYHPERDSWSSSEPRRFHREQAGESRAFDVPHSVVDDAITYSLPAALKKVERPILFVAGTHDEVVGVEPVHELYLGSQSPDREYVELPVQHDYRDVPGQRAKVNTAVLGWISQHLTTS